MLRCYSIAFVFLFYAATALAQNVHPGQPPFEPRAAEAVSSTRFFLKLRMDVVLSPGALRTGIPDVDALLAGMDVRDIRRMKKVRPALLKSGVERSGIERIFIVSTESQANMPALLARLAALPAVEYATPYRKHTLAYDPNDPEYSGQWELAQMKAADAWDITQGDSTIAIGIVDTGVDLFHPDLALNVALNSGEWGATGELSNNGIDDDGNGFVDDWRGWDFIGTGDMANPVPDNEPQDNQIGHGTGVAGAAAAVTDNGVGIASPGFRTKFLPVKVAGDQSDGVEAGYEGILYAVDMGCRVIVCGWELDYAQDPAMRDIVDYAHENGSLVIVAAGNEQTNIDILRKDAVIQRTLHVGGTTKNAGMSFFSNRGISVDVFAPGSSVQVAKKGGGTEILDGTSYSAGYAAGVAALVFSVHPDWTPDQVARQLRVTSTPFSTGRKPDTYGILNAHDAVSVNQTLGDRPGIVMRNVTVAYPEGDGFTAIGQTATVRAWLVNLLAPSSAQTQAELTLADGQITSPTTTIPVGALGTYDSVQIQFDVTLTEDALYTYATIPFSITITDGEYIDYAVSTLRYSELDGWDMVYDSDGAHAVRAMSAVDENTVWAVLQTSIYNYTIIRTTDGGETWEDRAGQGFPTDYRVRALSALDANTAFAGIWADGPVDAGVYRTTDGGANWERYGMPDVTDFINFVHMFDASEGVVEGDPLDAFWGIAKTYDGGDTWAKPAQRPPAVGEVGVTGAFAFSAETGFFGTYNQKIYKTTDKGETWTAVPTPDRNIGGIAMRNTNDVLLRFFNDGTAGTNMYALSTDGGGTWQQVAPTTPQAFGVVLLEPNGKKVWIGVNSMLYVSRDNGQTWEWERLPQYPVGIFGVADVVTDGDRTTAFVGGTEIYKRVLSYEPSSTSVGTLPAADAFRIGVYPNPVSSGRTVTLTIAAQRAGTMECTLYDLYGRTVRGQRIDNEPGERILHIPTAGLAAGVYTMVVRSGVHRETARITVLR